MSPTEEKLHQQFCIDIQEGVNARDLGDVKLLDVDIIGVSPTHRLRSWALLNLSRLLAASAGIAISSLLGFLASAAWIPWAAWPSLALSGLASICLMYLIGWEGSRPRVPMYICPRTHPLSGEPRIVVTPSVSELLRTFPDMPYDEIVRAVLRDIPPKLSQRREEAIRKQAENLSLKRRMRDALRDPAEPSSNDS